MAWRSIDARPRRAFWAAVFIAFFSVALSAQTAGVSLRLANGSGLIVAPSLQLPAAPSSAAVADLNGDGNPDMVVTSLTSGNVTVLLGDGKGGFGSSFSFPAGQQPGNVILADVTGDGRTDIVVTDRATGAVEVLAGRGDGTFGSATAFPAIANPVALTAANISGKGKIDLVVAAATGVAVLLNDGTGHFHAPSTFMLTSQPVALASADLRGQGHDDVLVASQNGALIVLQGDGTGQFQAQPLSAIASGPLSSIAVGDFNRDGKLDLAITSSSTNEATILLGRGNGTFQTGPKYTIGSTPTSILAVDLRGTGIQDLVTVNRGANTFSVLLGNGDGSFRSSLDFIAGNTPIAAVVGNFSGHGHPDVVTLNSQSNSVAMNSGNGDGTFVAARSYRSGGLDRKSIATGDLNGDGRPDLVVANFCGVDPACSGPGNFSVFLADANGAYNYSGNYTLGSGPIAVALADLKGDHKLALIALNRNDKSMTVMPGNGDGTFGQAQTYALSGNPRALLAADLNGDSKADLAIAIDCGQAACTQPGSLSIFLSRGDGSLAEAASYPTGFSPLSIAAGNLRGSGHSDLVVGNGCGEDATCKSQGTALVFANDGTGRLTRGTEINIGNAPSAIALGSLSGSGLDLVVAQSAANKVAVLHSDGNGGFGAPVAYSVGAAPSSVTLADIKGTGHLDVAVSNLQSSTLSVLFGAGNGSLQPAVTVPVGTNPETVIASTAGKGSPASLVTASGNTSTSPAAVDFTVIAHPMLSVNLSSFTLTATPVPTSVVNASVTLSVTAAGTAGTPTGSAVFNYSTDAGVTFNPLSDCGGPTGMTLDGTGAASCVTQQLPAGSLVLQAHYAGEPTVYNTADSNQVAETVTAVATTVNLAANPAAPTIDEVITLTATVKPTTAPAVVTDTVPIAGTIAFNDTTTATTLCAALPVAFDAVTGTASLTCQVPVLSLTTHSLNAVFVPSGGNYTGNTGILSLPVTAAPTVTTVVPTPSSANVDDSVGLAITVAPNVSGTLSTTGNLATITGTVTAYDGVGSTAIASCTSQSVTYVPANGNATVNCLTAALTAGSHSITAQFTSTSTDYTNSPRSAGAPVTISAAPTTVTMSAVPNFTVGDTVTLTATVKPTSGAAVTVPFAGSIAFRDGATAVAGCTPTFNSTTGVATCTTPDLAAGVRNITAIYNNTGDSNYSASAASAAQTPTGAKAATTTAVTQIADTTVGANVTLTATISLTDGNPIPPLLGMTGTVTFKTAGNATAICSANTISAAGVATCSTTALKVGTYAITATYAGDNNYTGSSNATAMIFNIAQVGTTAHMGAVANFTVDDNVTLTSTLTLNSGSGIPAGVPTTGTVTFLDGGAAIGGTCAAAAAITATGTATCSTATLIHGAHSITATYNGDTNYAASAASTAVTPTGTAVGTTETVSGPTSFAVNTSVTLTATLTLAGGRTITVPTTGNVTFLDGGNPITGCTTAASVNSAGVATCTATALGAGAHNITATYNGDLNYSASPQSAQFTTTGSTTLPTVTLTASAANQVVNTSLTFTATIAPPSGSTVAISGGTVDFTYSGGTLCSAVTVNTTTDKAACPYAALPAGTYTITATFSGDNNYKGAIGNLSQTVTPGSSTVGITTTGSPSTVNQLVTFNVTVTRNTPPAAVVPLTGNVTVTDSASGTALACSAFNPANGTLNCPTQGLALGSHTLTATYSGDASYPGSGTVNQVVNKGTVTLAVSPSSSPITFNSTVTFTATVAPPAGPTGLTGTVEFQDTPQGGTAADISGCSAIGVTGGKALCSTSSLIKGNHTITVIYNGDNNFNTPAAPATTTVVVNQATGNTLTIASSSNPAAVNQASTVNFTATLTINTGGSIAGITGTVGFTDNNNPIANCTAQSLSVQPPLAGKTIPTTAIAVCSDPALAATNSPHTIAASYTGDSNFGSAAGTMSGNETVNAAATSLALASSKPTSIVNDSVSFTATLTMPTVTGGVPVTGTVAFVDSVTKVAIPGCSASAILAATKQAVCTTSDLVADAHTITATYTDSASPVNFQTSSNTAGQTVNAQSTSVSVQTTVTPSAYQQLVTFTATLGGGFAPGKVSLVGKMTFTDSVTSAAIPGCVLLSVNAAGLANCSTSALAQGTHTITATFNPDNSDPNFNQSSGTVQQSVVAAGTNAVLASDSASGKAIVNQKVTLTVTLSSPGQNTVNLPGTVDLTAVGGGNTIPICTLQPVIPAADQKTGTVICSVSTLPAAAYTVTATYTDTTNSKLNATSQLTEVIDPATANIKLTETDSAPQAAGMITVNDSVTLTAQLSTAISGGLPFKGTFNFLANGVNIPNCIGVPVATPTCVTTGLRAGVYPVSATYNSDPNYSFSATSNSSVGLTVLPAALSVMVSPSATTVLAYQSTLSDLTKANVTFTATVLDAAGHTYTVGSGTDSVPLTGTITFTDSLGSKMCIALSPPAGGAAVVSCQCNQGPTNTGLCPLLASGSQTITASYTGDPNFSKVLNGPDTTLQPVQGNTAESVEDYGISSSATPPYVFVTAGKSATTDPFAPATVNIVPNPVTGTQYTGSLTLTCTVNDASGNPLTTTPCGVHYASGTTLPVLSSGTQATAALSLDATNLTAGPYSVVINSVDGNGLQHSTTFNLYARAANTATVTVQSGGAAGAGTVDFVLPSTVTSAAFANYTLSCATLSGTGFSTPVPPASINITCGFNGTQTVNGQTVTVPVTINTGSSTSRVTPAGRSGYGFPAVLCIPILGLLGLLRARKSLKSALLLVLAAATLCATALQVTGCGGGIKTSVSNTTSGTTPPGKYFIRVTAQDDPKTPVNVFEAVIEVDVTL